MITEELILLFFGIPTAVFELLPEYVFDAVINHDGAAQVLGYALYFFPMDVWTFGIANIVLIMGITFVYAVVEWVYKKVPGVD